MAQVEEQVYTKDRPPPIEEQLSSVQAHIEDLEVNDHLQNHIGIFYQKTDSFYFIESVFNHILI